MMDVQPGITKVSSESMFCTQVSKWSSYKLPAHKDISISSALSFQSSCSYNSTLIRQCQSNTPSSLWFHFMLQAFTPCAVTREPVVFQRLVLVISLFISTYCCICHTVYCLLWRGVSWLLTGHCRWRTTLQTVKRHRVNICSCGLLLTHVLYKV